MAMITEGEICRYVMTIFLAEYNYSCIAKVHLTQHLLL